MKNKLLLGALFICAAGIFTACSDDNDSNPTLIQPTEFVLNTPVYGEALIDLEKSEAIQLQWSQPQYTADNAPINATYEAQISLSNTFDVSTAEAEADEEGTAVADYVIIDKTSTLCSMDLAAVDLNKALVKLAKWSENTVPANQKIYVRMNAYVLEGTKKLNAIVSNVVTLNVAPYYVELKDALPQLLFFVGPGAVGNWDNSKDVVIPMSLVKDAAYDKKTGEGKFTYTGWFAADQFKLVLNPGDWEPMYGLNGGSVAYRAPGDPDVECWQPAEAGYYTFTFDTTNGSDNAKAELVPYEGTPEVFAGWELIGGFNGWSDDGTIVLTQNAHTPHVWHAKATFDEDTEAKFRTLGSWDDECGGDGFPYGLKTGNNIKIAAGTYKIVYNDIDRCYFFISE